MKWASTVTLEEDLAQAAHHAADRIQEDLAVPPDLVVVFASRLYGSSLELVPDLLADRFGSCVIFGCSASGVIGGGREVEERPAFSLTAAVLPGVELSVRHLEGDALPERYAGAGIWSELLGASLKQLPHFLLLADPLSFPVEPLLTALDRVYPQSSKVGGMVSGGRNAGENLLFVGSALHRSGLASLALHGDLAVDTIVAQGCRPVGDPMFVTRAHDNLLLELDGQRPFDVLQQLFATLDAHDQALFRHSLFMGLVMRQAETTYSRGDFLIRNIVGVDEDSGALWVGGELAQNQVVQFHLRDALTSSEDLERSLAPLDRLPPAEQPCGSLLFSCLGRGTHLYGQPDHDSNAFRRHLGDVPLGGFFCSGEIGPVRGSTFLHGYTSAFALFRPA